MQVIPAMGQALDIGRQRFADLFAIEPKAQTGGRLRNRSRRHHTSPSQRSARKANAIMPPEHWAYDAAVKVHDHDPERAKQLLDEADLPDPDGDGRGPESRSRC